MHTPLYEQRHLFNEKFLERSWHYREDLKAIASINARMGSTRLPGKVMMKIGDKTVLDHIVDRLRRCTCLYDICLATTWEDQDDVLVDWAIKKGIPYYRGSTNDVLGRTWSAHSDMDSGVVVRVCGDTPFIDPETVDFEILAIKHDWADIVMSTSRRGFPHGTTAHVFSFKHLDWMARNLTDSVEREHVSLHMYEHPENFRIYEIQGADFWRCEGQRLQIDYPEDLEVANLVNAAVGDYAPVGRIAQWLRCEPGRRARAINAHCEETVVR